VAVLDSGMDPSHPDLIGAAWTNPFELPNGADDDRNGVVDDLHGADLVDGDGTPADDHGHGTAEASIVAGRGLVAVAGVAPAARVLPVRVLDRHNHGTTREAAAGIRYALGHGARILLMALNADRSDPDLEDAIAEAERAGAVVVATAGNDERDLDLRPSFPASLPSEAVLTVGAATATGERAWFSNWGGPVDVVAPGVGVLGAAPGGGTTTLDGTSPAAAHVAGALALLQGARPDLATTTIRDALVATAPGGRLDLLAALSVLGRAAPASAPARARRSAPQTRRRTASAARRAACARARAARRGATGRRGRSTRTRPSRSTPSCRAASRTGRPRTAPPSAGRPSR
jgi:subtilisin family serine protease